MDKLVSMIARRLMRQLVNKGVSAGMKAVAGKTPASSGQKLDQKRTKQSMRLLRRMSKF
ncbi:hypothetical protein [Cognatishimia sp. WU-CL00825]|uniref:hypothetical protein n=1 Tax=Cognatishimia sp. WU-CL00825 TaxID=3127658 RepID=UPI003365B152